MQDEAVSEPTFQPHRVLWTHEKAARFWSSSADLELHAEVYFSRMVGESLIRFVRRRGVQLSGRVLDFGCGPGFLLEKLLQAGVSCENSRLRPA